MSTLREAIHEYIEMRRHLGFKLKQDCRLLHQFARFMEQHEKPFITVELAVRWAQQPHDAQPAWWAKRLSAVRVFARHRKAIDPRTEIPPCELLAFKPGRAKPYLYSDQQIRDLLQVARKMSCSYERTSLRPWIYHCLFGLLAVSGMRVGEVCDLEVRDVDPDAAVLTIRGAKFGRHRLIALHHSTCDVITDYIARRERHWRGRCVSSYLFVSSRGNRIDPSDITRTFHKLSRQIGLRGETDGHGPRIHDLRHSFATKVLALGYRNHENPERIMPILSTWLGHVKIADTQWYLQASPQLLDEAMRRLETRWENQS